MLPLPNDPVALDTEATDVADLYAHVHSQLAGQSPEERELYLAIVRETRRVKELDLLIAEERRKEREAQFAALYGLQTDNSNGVAGPGAKLRPDSANGQSSQSYQATASFPFAPPQPESFIHSQSTTTHSSPGHYGIPEPRLSMTYPPQSSSMTPQVPSPPGPNAPLHPQASATRSQSVGDSQTSSTPQYNNQPLYSQLLNQAPAFPGPLPHSSAIPSMPDDFRSAEVSLGWGDASSTKQSVNGMTTSAISGPAAYPRPGPPSHPYLPHHQHHPSQGNYRPTAETYQVAALLRSPRREHSTDLPGAFERSAPTSAPYSHPARNGDSPFYEGNSPPQTYPLIPIAPALPHQAPPGLPSQTYPQHQPPYTIAQGPPSTGTSQQLQHRISTPSDSPSPGSYFSPLTAGLGGVQVAHQGTSASINLAPKKIKKLLVERQVACAKCSHSICKLLLRGTSEELSQECDLYYECLRCVPPSPPSGLGINKQIKKRTRQTEDLSVPTVCDVCIKTIGRGGLIPKLRGFPVGFAVEVVCTSCALRYNRCSDCGGGSGRVGVGKWRAKELFENGRKTCRLPHVRLGSGEIEVSVWELTHEIENKKELPSLMNHLKTLWSERVLARLAIPEVLEGGDDEYRPDMEHRPQRTFAEVEELIARGWPARETCISSQPPPGVRRYLGLSWAKTRARRERAAGKTPDRQPSNGSEYDPANDTLMENVRRTNVLVPQASTLVGMWLMDWCPATRSVLLSTSAPFETADAEDRSIVGVGEMLTRIMQDFMMYNATHPEAPLQPPMHLWVAARAVSPASVSRMNDTLTRRRGFLSLEEYLRTHPGVDRSIFTNIPDGHTWSDEPGWVHPRDSSDLDILVRWLGDDIDMAKLESIKEMEYGKKSREVAIAKGRRVCPPAAFGKK